MKRSLYIPEDIWLKLGELSDRLGLGSKSKVICYLVMTHAHYTHTEKAGETPMINVIGRECDVVKVDGVARYDTKKVVGGVLRVSVAEVEKVSPEIAENIRGMGSCEDDSVVELHLPEVTEPGTIDNETAEGLKGYKSFDVAKVVKADDEKGKSDVVAKIKDDLNAIMNRGVRSYSKDKQLGKDRKK